MKVICNAYFTFKRKNSAEVADKDNWIGTAPELIDWLSQLPDEAMIDVAYPMNMGDNSLVARWEEER